MARWPGAILVALLGLVSPAALATNGLNLIGFGAESIGMGGADLAVARDPAALNINPAGLAQLHTARLDITPSLAFAVSQRHSDALGNDRANKNTPVPILTLAYAQPIAGTRLTAGIGVFAQGGAGVDYDQVKTAVGTVDNMSITLGIARLVPGVAWQVNDSLSLGVSVIACGATLEQKLFPATSVAPLFGLEAKNLKALGLGTKLGLQYRINDRVRWGLSYTTKTDLNFHGGELRSNQSGVGLGVVTYRDAKVTGLATPQELGIGVAFRPVDRLLLATEINWVNWAGAVKSATLFARDPDGPAVLPDISVTNVHNWRDQYVFAIGAAYDWDENVRLRAGYNYGRNPIPAGNLTPFFPTIAEHHLTAGLRRRLNAHWSVDGALEYQLNNRVTYTNPQLPFGPGAAEEYEVFIFHVMLSREW